MNVTRGYVKVGPARDEDEDEDEDEDDPDEGAKRRRVDKKKMAPNKRKNRESGAGFSDPNHQTLGMGNERFMVPEALFHPSDVGLKQAGVAEATARAVEAVKRDARLKGLFYANVVLCGGCAALPGFKERFERELRPFVDAGDVVNVSVAADGDPVGAAWRGGSRLGRQRRVRANRADPRGVPQRPGGDCRETRATRARDPGARVTRRKIPDALTSHTLYSFSYEFDRYTAQLVRSLDYVSYLRFHRTTLFV